jgi:hypothetical protein
LAKKTAVKVNLFFPLYNNDGDPFEEEIWRWWRESLTLLLAGFSEMGVVHGWWQGHSDVNLWVAAVVRTEIDVRRIRSFLRLARAKFQQKAMYLEYHRVHFEEIS